MVSEVLFCIAVGILQRQHVRFELNRIYSRVYVSHVGKAVHSDENKQ